MFVKTYRNILIGDKKMTEFTSRISNHIFMNMYDFLLELKHHNDIYHILINKDDLIELVNLSSEINRLP